MDTVKYFASYINRLTLSGEYAKYTRNQNMRNLDLDLWDSLMNKFSKFSEQYQKYIPPTKDFKTFGKISIDSNLFIYHRDVENLDMDVAIVDYKYMYPSRFTKSFLNEGYKTNPQLESLYPLMYKTLTTQSDRLTEDSLWVLRYTLNFYYRVHNSIRSKYDNNESPIIKLHQAIGDIKSKPLVYMYLDTFCFDISKLESKDYGKEINEILSGVDALLHKPSKTINLNTTINLEMYNKSKKNTPIIGVDFLGK